MNRTAGADPHFAALSAYALKTAISEQQDSHTTLFQPRIPDDDSTALEERGTVDGKVNSRRGRDFVLWKIASS